MKINSPFNFSLWNEDLANAGFKSGAHTARLPRSKYMQPGFLCNVDNENKYSNNLFRWYFMQTRAYIFLVKGMI